MCSKIGNVRMRGTFETQSLVACVTCPQCVAKFQEHSFCTEFSDVRGLILTVILWNLVKNVWINILLYMDGFLNHSYEQQILFCQLIKKGKVLGSGKLLQCLCAENVWRERRELVCVCERERFRLQLSAK